MQSVMERLWFDRDKARRLTPFAAAAVVGLGLAALPPAPPTLNIVLAAGLLVAVVLCPLLFRWVQPPAPLAILPPLAFLAVVGLLRGDHGTGTGFGPLALLPVFWIALYGRRWQLGVILAGVGVLFALPLTGVVGHGYHAADLRYAAIWVVVSALVGLTAQTLVGREREQRRSLARQHELLDAMFAAAGSLVAVVEPDGRIARVNPACERLGGFAEREIAGRFFWDVLMPAEEAARMGRWWERRVPAERAGVAETAMVDRDGGRHQIHWTLEALPGAAGEVASFVATGLDITEERAAQRALREERDRFNSVLRASTEHSVIGSDEHGLITIFNDGAERMLGYRAEEMIGRRTPEVIHDPAEIAARAAELGVDPGFEVFVHAARGGASDTRDWTYVRADGSRLTVSLTVTAIPGPDGTPSGFIGIAHDVSASRRTEAALAESEYQLRTVLSHLPGAVVSLYDRNLRCLMIEGSSLAERGIDASEFIGLRLEESVPAENAAALRPVMEAALTGEEASVEYESHRDDTVFEVEVLPYEQDGEIRGALTVSRDITQRKRFERELQHLAEHDPLTGLLNRRRFEAELQRHLAHIARYGDAGALIMLDADRFKEVNDTLGHARGDELLVLIARAVDERLRALDSAARLGGDEFAILLPEANREQAKAAAQRLVAAVRARRIEVPGESRPVTLSAGVMTFAESGELSPGEALIEADLAMYEAKAAGGDCVRFRPDRVAPPPSSAQPASG